MLGEESDVVHSRHVDRVDRLEDGDVEIQLVY